uniref:Tryptophanase 2 n=1 Tax=Mastigamoeba balamuthi TaxID=108607 RepID=A0A1S5WM49_MASBA|nr:tryptophanase 2 [Mastigamoeba balamuthi]|eukprot:m51a1_g667 putative tryptophanase (555) ;mRNA; f:244026-246345
MAHSEQHTPGFKGQYDLGVQPPTQRTLVVRAAHQVTAEERERVQVATEYNGFAFSAGMLLVDFLSDSGASAMTDAQWAALVRGDEAYGGNHGLYAIVHAIRDTFERPRPRGQAPVVSRIIADDADDIGEWWRQTDAEEPAPNTFANWGRALRESPNFFVLPQGRCAENLIFGTVGEVLARENAPKPWRIPCNGFFDTTEAQASVNHFTPTNLFSPHFHDAFSVADVDRTNPFKGNIDIARLEKIFELGGTVPMVLLTVTNNTAAGQPVSMRNIEQAAQIAHAHGVPLVFDAARFAENAWFIHEFEEGWKGRPILDIVHAMFSHCDAFTMSAKKDGLGNIGGFLCFRNKGLFHKRFSTPEHDVGSLLQEKQIMRYGNASHGGLSGRDIMALAAGFYQVVRPEYLRRRVLQTRKLAVDLVKAGVAGVIMPPGGHAVYLDMTPFFEGTPIKIDDFAGVGFEIELIRLYGIRCCELGPFAFEWDQKNAEQRKGILNLVRFAIPRNMYNEDHMSYTVAAIAELYKHREKIPKVTVARGAELHLRHFQSGLKPDYYNGKL